MFAFARRQRAMAEIERRRGDGATYTAPLPRGAPDLKPFLSDFYRNVIFAPDDRMRSELQKYPVVRQWYQTLVVQQKRVAYEDFWQRYYYRTASVERVQAELEAEDDDRKRKRLEGGGGGSSSAAATAFRVSNLLAGGSQTARNVVSTFVGDRLATAASITAATTASTPATATAASSVSGSSSAVTEKTATAADGGDGNNLPNKKKPSAPAPQQEQSTETAATTAAAATMRNEKDTTAASASASADTTTAEATPAITRWNGDSTWRTAPRPAEETTKVPMDKNDHGNGDGAAVDRQGFLGTTTTIWPVPSAAAGKEEAFAAAAAGDGDQLDDDFASQLAECPSDETATAETPSPPPPRGEKSKQPVPSSSPSKSSRSSSNSPQSSSSSSSSPSRSKAPPKEVFDSLLPAYYKKMKRGNDDNKAKKEGASKRSLIREFSVSTTATADAADAAAVPETKNGGTTNEEPQSQSNATTDATDRDEKHPSSGVCFHGTAKPAAAPSTPPPADDGGGGPFWDPTEPPPPENVHTTTGTAAAARVITPPHRARDKVASIRDSVTKGEISIPSSPPSNSKRTIAVATTTTTTTTTKSRKGGGGSAAPLTPSTSKPAAETSLSHTKATAAVKYTTDTSTSGSNNNNNNNLQSTKANRVSSSSSAATASSFLSPPPATLTTSQENAAALDHHHQPHRDAGVIASTSSSGDELRHKTSPGDDAPSVPQRESEEEEDSPVKTPAQSGSFSAPSCSPDRDDWQERIEQVNVDASSSPSFVETKKRIIRAVADAVRKPANAKSEDLLGSAVDKAEASVEEKASNKVLPDVFDRKSEYDTSSESKTAVEPTTAGRPRTAAGKISLIRRFIDSRSSANRKETTTPADGSSAKANTRRKEGEDSATGTKTVEKARTSALSTKPMSKEAVQPKAARLRGRDQDETPKESIRMANSKTEMGKGVASLVAKYEKKSSATQEDAMPKTSAAAARGAASATSDSDPESKIAILLSVLVLLIAAAAGIFLSLAPSTSLGDWLCGPVRPMRTLNYLPEGVHSIYGEAPWFAPASVKQVAFDRVCGADRIRTKFEWTEQNSKHRSLDIVDAQSGKRLLHQKKILHSMFDTDHVEYLTDKSTKRWTAPWRFVRD